MHASGGEEIDLLRAETENGTINSYESDEFPEVTFGQLNASVSRRSTTSTPGWP